MRREHDRGLTRCSPHHRARTLRPTSHRGHLLLDFAADILPLRGFLRCRLSGLRQRQQGRARVRFDARQSDLSGEHVHVNGVLVFLPRCRLGIIGRPRTCRRRRHRRLVVCRDGAPVERLALVVLGCCRRCSRDLAFHSGIVGRPKRKRCTAGCGSTFWGLSLRAGQGCERGDGGLGREGRLPDRPSSRMARVSLDRAPATDALRMESDSDASFDLPAASTDMAPFDAALCPPAPHTGRLLNRPGLACL